MNIESIVILVVTFLIALFFYNLKQRKSKQEKMHERKNKITNQYVDRSINISGLKALKQHGITDLENEEDAKDVIKMIIKRGKGNPLPKKYRDRIEEFGILNFFTKADINKLSDSNHIEEILSKKS